MYDWVNACVQKNTNNNKKKSVTVISAWNRYEKKIKCLRLLYHSNWKYENQFCNVNENKSAFKKLCSFVSSLSATIMIMMVTT